MPTWILLAAGILPGSLQTAAAHAIYQCTIAGGVKYTGSTPTARILPSKLITSMKERHDPRKKFSTEFKRRAVELMRRPQAAAIQAAREFGVNANALSHWRQELANH